MIFKISKKGTFGKTLAPNSTFTILNGLQIRDFQIRDHFLGPKNRELGGLSVKLLRYNDANIFS